MSKISEARLAEAKTRIQRSRRRKPLGEAYHMSQKHVNAYRGNFTAGVDEDIWNKRSSPWGVETARIKIDLWEFHIMRYRLGVEEHYMGMVINGDYVKRIRHSCRWSTPTAKVLNDMFNVRGILFVTKNKRSRKTRSDRKVRSG